MLLRFPTRSSLYYGQLNRGRDTCMCMPRADTTRGSTPVQQRQGQQGHNLSDDKTAHTRPHRSPPQPAHTYCTRTRGVPLVTLMEAIAISNGPAEKLGLSSPSSSNFESMSWKELMLLGENGRASVTDSVRKL